MTSNGPMAPLPDGPPGRRIALATVLALFVCAVALVFIRLNLVERDVEQAAHDIVSSAGYDTDSLTFEADFRDLKVSGYLPDGLSRHELRQLLEFERAGDGGEQIRYVTVDASELDPTQSSRISVTALSDGASLELVGSLPVRSLKTILLDAVAQTDLRLDDKITVTGLDPVAANPQRQVQRLADVLTHLDGDISSALLFLDDEGPVEGSILTESEFDAAVLKSLLDSSLHISSTATRNSLSVEVNLSDSAIVLSGKVLNSTHRDQLFDAASDLVGPQQVTNNVVVTRPGQTPDEKAGTAAVEGLVAVIGSLTDADWALVTLEANNLTVAANVNSPAAADAIAEAVDGLVASGLRPFREIQVLGAESKTFDSAEIHAANLAFELEALSSLIAETVVFQPGQSQLDDAALETLSAVAEAVGRHPKAVIVIEGHTDDVGPSDENLLLSERRAGSVAAYLISQGVAQDRIDTRGYGESLPISTADSDLARSLNRRIEIISLDTFQ